jgi:hypothetical protein
MKKIPTLFQRDPQDMRHVTREVHPACQWVVDGEGVATRKYDGTCVALLHTDGTQVSVEAPTSGPSLHTVELRWFARREVKPGKREPDGFVPVDRDGMTGKTVGWEPIEQSAYAKWHSQALASHAAHFGPELFDAGTYELIGVKVNGNPERIDPDFGHQLVSHDHAEKLDAPRDYDGLAAFLANFPGEGIVWHHPDGRMAKIKRRDFGIGQ